jgi:hypothetical protein
LIVQLLQNELGVKCDIWDPTRFMQLELSPKQATELQEIGPQLSVAVGAALAAL